MLTLLRDEFLDDHGICPLLSRHGEKDTSWEKFLTRLIQIEGSNWEGATFRTIKDKVKELLKARAKGDAVHPFLSGTAEEFSQVDKLLTELNQVSKLLHSNDMCSSLILLIFFSFDVLAIDEFENRQEMSKGEGSSFRKRVYSLLKICDCECDIDIAAIHYVVSFLNAGQRKTNSCDCIKKCINEWISNCNLD